MSWEKQDPILITLWRRGEGVDYILARLAEAGEARKKTDIYRRVGELRAKGMTLMKRPRGGRWASNSKFAGKTETVNECEVVKRIDEDGRLITVCPPRWCAGSRTSWWG